ncbi:MAG: Hsp70 family protein [Bdellovibrio sp. CG10_big_fil_rev_8_21_14_0_10_47_8]|nr:MAG: Hsp70 family protein [Bdellovibrio sp. CG10_big_fil_rev_8_21_14_0_10_47_8]
MSDVILAIDFGTSNSLVGAFRPNERIEALPLDPSAEDPTLMRTLLYFPDASQCYYGNEALQKFIEFDMEGRLFRSFKSHLPNKSYLGTMIENRILSLENLIGIFLLEIKKRSEKILGIPIERAVIGRPARYSMDDVADGFALHRMKKAAEFAGFKDVLFLPEPLAAAFDYRRQSKTEKIVLIGDFGGGTSDFTIMKMSDQPFQKSDVLSVDGCPQAGDALDSVFMSERLNVSFGAKTQYRLPMSSNVLSMPQSVMERLTKPSHIVHLKERETYHFIQEVQKCALRDDDKKALQRLFILIEDQQIYSFFEEIEKVKRALSDKATATFSFSYPDLETNEIFSQQEFQVWSEKVRSSIFTALERCLVQAQLKDHQIDHVFLTGGTAYVPFIRQEFASRFGSQKLETKSFFHSVLSGLIEGAAHWDLLQESRPTI